MEWIGPWLIPVFALLIPICAIVAGAFIQISANRTEADERMAMIARGTPLPEIDSFLKANSDDKRSTIKDPLRSLGRARRAAVVLISLGLGLIAFFTVLTIILQVHEVFAGAAAGLIPLLIGLGFVVDYRLQKRELSRFGMEFDSDLRKN